MQTVRRLYLYAMSGVTLGVLAVGLQFVLVVLFDAIGLSRGSLVSFDPNGNRQQLSLAAALIGVGLPVWAVHWWLAERGLRSGAARVEEERGSTVRASTTGRRCDGMGPPTDRRPKRSRRAQQNLPRPSAGSFLSDLPATSWERPSRPSGPPCRRAIGSTTHS